MMTFRIAISRLFPGEKLQTGDSRYAELNASFANETHTIPTLTAELRAGAAICPTLGRCDREHHGGRWCCPEVKDAAHCGRPDGYRTGHHFESAQHLGLDFDRGNLSCDDLRKDAFIAQHAAIMYETISSAPEARRWRVLFILTEPIKDAETYRRAARALLHRFETSDPSVKDAVRLFYGMKPGAGKLVVTENTLPMGELLRLMREYDTAVRERLQSMERRTLPPVDPAKVKGSTPAERYVNTAIEQERAHLAALPAVDGTRYPAIIPAALRLASLKESPWLPEGVRSAIDVEAVVMDASRANGVIEKYGDADILKAIGWAITHAQPRPEPAGWAAEQDPKAAAPAPCGPPIELETCLDTFRRWMHLPDAGHVEVALGVLAANYGTGDPVWLLLVAPASSGKTEPLTALAGLPNVYLTATITEGGLLSGSPQKDRAAGAKGGLLRQIGDFGILVLKDFSGMLTLAKDSRGAVLSALREVYDGAWTRHLGQDGGKELHWAGKLGLIGAATPAIDMQHAVMGLMGERFLLYRLMEGGESERALRALNVAGQEAIMRAELADAVQRLFAGVKFPDGAPALTEGEKRWLVSLATLAARCRSAVHRDGYRREIEGIAGAEQPTRMIKALALLFAGLLAVGCSRDRAWHLIHKTAMDSMPATRLAVLTRLWEAAQVPGESGELQASAIAHDVALPTATVRRALEELDVYRVVHRTADNERNLDWWGVTEWAARLLARISEIPPHTELESISGDQHSH